MLRVILFLNTLSALELLLMLFLQPSVLTGIHKDHTCLSMYKPSSEKTSHHC